MILNINKPLGITSYDVIRQLKKKYPGEKIGHAGTLDPLAEGVLICLVGKDSTARQSEFMNVNKEYEFDVLFGVETDTYDVLGFINNFKSYDADNIVTSIESNLNSGEINQPVPPVSAVKIKGKPLYRWYLEGRINEVEVPVKTIKIDSIEIVNSRNIDTHDLKKEILNLLDTVKSGFRQDQIKEKWNGFFENPELLQDKFLVMRFKAVVSKGAYVRAIAHELGQKLGIGACTLTITRTRVGDFKIADAQKI